MPFTLALKSIARDRIHDDFEYGFWHHFEVEANGQWISFFPFAYCCGRIEQVHRGLLEFDKTLLPHFSGSAHRKNEMRSLFNPRLHLEIHSIEWAAHSNLTRSISRSVIEIAGLGIGV